MNHGEKRQHKIVSSNAPERCKRVRSQAVTREDKKFEDWPKRAVLAAKAGNDVLRQYDENLDPAFERAREQGDLTPLAQTVRRWWFEADAWRDPDAQREFLAPMDTYRNEGLPPSEQRMTREEIQARFGV